MVPILEYWVGKLLGFKSHTFWRVVDTAKDLTAAEDHHS
jgi:hypothetical protein